VPLSATLSPPACAAPLRTTARIVVAGSGLGGIAVANRLSRMLDGASITIVDAKEEHNYQPGYTLVATGVWPVDKVRDRNIARPRPPGRRCRPSPRRAATP
jgi:sulfide:quinone oxidoreductase